MEDIQQQLSVLLGKQIRHAIRKTDEDPPRISAIDIAIVLTGKSHHDAAQDFRRIVEQYPEVGTNCSHFRFKGRGQRGTPIAAIRGAVELVFLLPGRQAARVRRQAADLLVRWLGGDLGIISEVCTLRGFQEELAVRAPEDPRRVFGAAVEAAAGPTGEQMARMFSEFNAMKEVLSRIQERLDEDRTRVNLNVRAPKRAAPYQQQIARDLAGAGRPFPVSRFLDEKEREDPTWAAARRSFAPAFSMTVQVLKKKKLREEGKAAVYVEQNHRSAGLFPRVSTVGVHVQLPIPNKQRPRGRKSFPTQAPVDVHRGGPRRHAGGLGADGRTQRGSGGAPWEPTSSARGGWQAQRTRHVADRA